MLQKGFKGLQGCYFPHSFPTSPIITVHDSSSKYPDIFFRCLKNTGNCLKQLLIGLILEPSLLLQPFECKMTLVCGFTLFFQRHR